MPAQKVLDPEHDPVVKWKLVQRDRSCSRARPIGNGDWTGLTMTISSYGSKIGYQSTNKMCIFAVNRPFLGLVIWARPKESTGRTQRTLDCFHAELVIKSLERLVDFRFFQTSKPPEAIDYVWAKAAKKKLVWKDSIIQVHSATRQVAPSGSGEGFLAKSCSSAMLCYALPVWVWRAPHLDPFDQNVFMVKEGHGSSQGSPLYLRLRPQHRKLSKWCNQRIGEMVDTVNTTHFWQVICEWYIKYVIQLRNVVRTTINHPPSPIWPELCLAIPSP